MAEFGINPEQSGEMSMVSTTTTTTTYVNTAAEVANGSEAVAGSDAAQALAAATGTTGAATEPATASADPLQQLIGTVDSDGDGQISGAELSTFVAQLSSQLEAASKKYNDVALASASSSKTLNEAA